MSTDFDAEKDALVNGPLSILTNAVKERTAVMISCRNNKKLLGRVKAFDRHFNMILENVQEIWQEAGKGSGAKAVVHERFISKMFLRGDGVILVVAEPK